MRMFCWLGLVGCIGGSDKGDSGSGDANHSSNTEPDCPYTEVTGDVPFFIHDIDTRGQGDDYQPPPPVEAGVMNEDLAFRFTPDNSLGNVFRIEFGLDVPDDVEMTAEEMWTRRSWAFKGCDQSETDYGVPGATHLINVSDGDPVTVVVEGCQGYCYLGFGVDPIEDMDLD